MRVKGLKLITADVIKQTAFAGGLSGTTQVSDLRGLASTMSGPAFANMNRGGRKTQGSLPAELQNPDANDVVQLGPGYPSQPFPLGGDPRQYQFRPGWNIPSGPGEGRPISMDTLRAVASTEWLMRRCIEIKKDKVLNLQFDIVARERKSYVRQQKVMKDNEDLIEDIKKAFIRPDGRRYFKPWLRALLEDHYVIDAMALYKRRNMDPDQGPKTPDGKRMGKLIALEQIDATSIKPLLDDSGRLPLPPLPAYQQFLFGIPRYDFTSQELIYAVHNTSAFSPYGYSPVEQFLFLVNLNLRYWAWLSARYTDGTLPEGVAESPPNWTAQQIEGINEYWDRIMAGDPRALRKLHFVPSGFKWHEFKVANDFDREFTRILIELACSAFGLTTKEFGLDPMHAGASGQQKDPSEVRDESYERATQPTVNTIIDGILNPILWEEFGATDLEWSVVDEGDEGQQEKAKAIDISLRNGRVSLDQVIEEDGGTPIGAGRFFVAGPQLILGEPDIKLISEQGWVAFQKQVAALAAAGAAPGADAGASDAGPMPRNTGQPNPKLEPEKITNNIKDEQAKKPMPYQGASYKAADDDLHRWQRKALKAVESGKLATVKFESDAIPGAVKSLISSALQEAKTKEDVKTTFSAIQKFSGLSTHFDDIQAELVRRTTPRERPVIFKPEIHVDIPASNQTFNMKMPEQPAPNIVVQSPDVHVAEREVHVAAPIVNVEAAKAADVHFNPEIRVDQPEIHIPKADVHVHPTVEVKAPDVHVNLPTPEKKNQAIRFERDADGKIKNIQVSEDARNSD